MPTLRTPSSPTQEGFYWARWRAADKGTQDGGVRPPDDVWGVVEVVQNDEPGTLEHMRVLVPGVLISQTIGNFEWWPGPPLPPPTLRLVRGDHPPPKTP